MPMTPPAGALTRRGLLAGLCAAPLVRPAVAAAQAMAERTLGGGVLATFSDGALGFPDVDTPTPDATAEQVAALRAASGRASGPMRPVNVTLLRRGDRVILFDAGGGAQFQPTVGLLPARLAAAGIAADDVTDILLTHAHPDHLWGVLDEFDEAAYPNATLRVARAELDYWTDPGVLDSAPAFRAPHVIGAQNRFDALSDRIAPFDDGAEVAPGVEAVATPGHTPGHTAFAVHGPEGGVLVAGDALTDPVLSVERPAWRSVVDLDAETAVTTRLRLLDRLAADGMAFVAYHLPEPGLHRIARRADGFVLEDA